MPTRTFATSYRQRHHAIGRKGEYEASMLFSNDDENADSQLTAPMLNLKDQQVEQPSKPSSPMSIAATFDDISITGDVKPLTLPGAWVVVGKKGRALKNEKMYEEPEPAKKKKKKARARKATMEPEELVVTLEAAPSTSKCLDALGRSSAQRQKQLARAQDAKHWARYHRAKEAKRGALDELVAALSLLEHEPTLRALEVDAAPEPTKDNKANSAKDKARRRARTAAAAAQFFSHEELDDEAPRAPPDSGADKSPAKRKARRARGSREVSLPGVWITVGKNGKALSNFPPLHKAPSDITPAKRAAPTETSPSSKSADSKRGKGGYMTKCSVM